jgi:pimeloyl-ACP methyl ester carboxylesterase
LNVRDKVKGIKKLALYEPPLILDDSRSTTEDDWVRIGEAVAADRRSDAVRIFLKSVGLPSFFIALMRLLPMWSKLKALAHTLPCDGAIMRDNQRGQPLPSGRWASITVPALVMAGGNSPAWMRRWNKSLARVLPNGQYRSLEGQTHMLNPKVHAPLLVEFFKD